MILGKGPAWVENRYKLMVLKCMNAACMAPAEVESADGVDLCLSCAGRLFDKKEDAVLAE